jgi:hypothetical protein
MKTVKSCKSHTSVSFASAWSDREPIFSATVIFWKERIGDGLIQGIDGQYKKVIPTSL